MSTSVLRSQTTAQLEALASITKAPSTSSLITAAKKASTNSSVHGSGGANSRNTPKFGSASAHMAKFSSRIIKSPMKSAPKSATKAPPSNLLNLKSFLPGKATVQKPSAGETIFFKCS